MTKNITLFNTKIPALFFAIISLICGILWSSLEYSIASPIIIITFFAITFAIFYKKIPLAIKILLITATPILIGHLRYQNQIYSHNNFYKQYKNKKLTITAEVTEITEQENKRTPFRITISTKQILEESSKNLKSIKKNIYIYLQKKPHIKIGNIIKIQNITVKKPKNKNFVAYLAKQQISATIFMINLKHTLIESPKHHFARWLHEKRENLFFSLKKKMSPQLSSLFSSIFLGNKNFYKKKSQKLKIKFRAWGVLHILARSGLHLIVFLLVCELLLKLIPICFYLKQIIILILSILYLLLSWPSISFIRAFSALIFYKICPFLNTKPDLLYILTITCLTMLIFNPIQIFFLDFQLSFLLTLTLALFNKIKTRKPPSSK